MERNRWETAIRCLEIAVHPNTSAEEIVAAVNGFRRTAKNTPLAQLCRELGDAAPGHLLGRLDQLNRENRELRRKVAEADAQRAADIKRLDDAEQRALRAAEELVAAEHRADIAERRLIEMRGAYGRLSGGLHQENSALQRALDGARRNLAQPIHEPVKPFQAMLDAVLQRPDRAPHSAQGAIAAPSWTA